MATHRRTANNSPRGVKTVIDVSADDQSFVMFRDTDLSDQSNSGHVTPFVNWFEELERLVSTGR